MAKSKKKLADVTKASQNKALQYEIQWIDWIIWGIYAAIIFYVTAHHEPWRDEAQSWLIARDNSISSLFAYLPNEGHPPLWYLLLMPFSKLGLPYFTANIIHIVIAVVFAWLLLFKIRIPRWLSASILFSYFFLYEYAVIARNYSMVALLLAIAGTLYPKRFERPFWYALVIFLLFQTNILAFCVGAGLGLLFLWDMIESKNFKWKNFAALGVMAAGGLAMIILLLSAGLKSSYSREAEDKVAAFLETFGNAMLVDKESGGFAVFIFVLIAFCFIPRLKSFVFLIVATAGFLYLIVFQFQGTLRHHGFLLIFLTGAFILSSFEKNQKWAEKIEWVPNVGRIIFSAVMILQFFKGLAVIQDELERNFSDSGNAARFIIDNGLDKYTIVGHRSYAASAVAPYLPNRKKIWYADQQRFGTFVYLDTVFFNNYLKYNADYAPYIVKEKFSKPDSILLLLNMPIQFPEFQRQWQLLYQTKEEPIKRDEIYFIYRYVYL